VQEQQVMPWQNGGTGGLSVMVGRSGNILDVEGLMWSRQSSAEPPPTPNTGGQRGAAAGIPCHSSNTLTRQHSHPLPGVPRRSPPWHRHLSPSSRCRCSAQRAGEMKRKNTFGTKQPTRELGKPSGLGSGR